MPGKHHIADRLPQRAWTLIGGVLALAFVAGMVLLVQNKNAREGGTAVFEHPRSAAVVSAASTPTRTVSSPPPAPTPSASTPAKVVVVEPPTRPSAARPPTSRPARTEAGPAPTPPRTSSAATPQRPASAIAATYAVGASWDTGFIGGFEVRNTSRTNQNFTISIRHDGRDGVRVVTAWNATLNRQGDTNVFTGGPIAPGESIRVGFEATKRVPGRVRPAACTASNGSCRVS